MFIDTRRLDEGSAIEAEVCVIGGGIAGITLAREFEKRGIGTCLIESGGFKPDNATRELYRGENVGVPYRFADGCRSRFLGGSSNCWSGWCKPMEEQDFARREWVPHSGWPFAKSELQPYYERALGVLGIGPNRFDTDFWVDAIGNSEVRRIPFITGRVTDGIAQRSPLAHFGRLYWEELARSKHVTVYLYANAVDIEIDGAEKVCRLKVKTLTGRTASVAARIFVLATGGIENARLLLVSNKVRPEGLGNHADLAGRFFMDHPRLCTGQIHFREAWPRNILYDNKYNYQNKASAAHGIYVGAQFRLTPESQAKERLLNVHVCFVSVFPGEDSEVKNAMVRMKQMLERKEHWAQDLIPDMLTLLAHPIDAAGFVIGRYRLPRSLVKLVRFVVLAEPLPNPDSRVVLSHQSDRLGVNRVKVDWRVGELVKRSIDRTLAIVADELASAGVADVILDPPIEGEKWPSAFEIEGTWHHMGTTRMDDSPKLGVVDRNCRVHGTSNLYVAGSSVFPTTGGNPPTITIVALALRLSDHIASAMRRPVSVCP